MTDAPKRIAFRKKYMSDAITNGPLMDDPNYIHYIRADLSADLVRAALEEAAERLLGTIRREYGDHRDYRKAVLALSADPEAIAAIVARVTEGK